MKFQGGWLIGNEPWIHDKLLEVRLIFGRDCITVLSSRVGISETAADEFRQNFFPCGSRRRGGQRRLNPLALRNRGARQTEDAAVGSKMHLHFAVIAPKRIIKRLLLVNSGLSSIAISPLLDERE